MKNIINNVKGNAYKILHSKILLVHILVPTVAVLIFGAYYSYSLWSEAEKVLAYMQVIAMAFPLMIAIVITMLYEMDLRSGGFANLLMVPYSKITAHLGNLLPMLLLGFCAEAYAIVGFGCVFRRMGYTGIPILVYFEFALMMFGANISVYILQYIICYEFGKGISLGVGVLGTLLSPLLCMGIGDRIWKYIPCSYGIRFSTCSFRLKYNTIDRILKKDYQSGSIVALAVTILVFVLFLAWSCFGQCKGQSEE